MRDVAILGAGELGGSLAHVLAKRDVVGSIRLIDSTGHVAAGKALDIMQAAPIERFVTRVSGSADIANAAGAQVVIVADAANGTAWDGAEALQILRQLSRGADRVVVCAGAAHRDLVERGVLERTFQATRLFGTAPEAFASALRALVALVTNSSVNDIALTLLGIPPDQVVVPWDEIAIGGLDGARVLDEPGRRRLAAKLPLLWPPGPYALATAAAEAVACMAGHSRRALSCFVAPIDSAGKRTRTAALPVRLGPEGVVRVEIPTLSVAARVALDNAMLL